MPLVKCHRCGAAVDDDAAAVCPNCGAPVITQEQRRVKAQFARLAIALLVMAIMAFFLFRMVNKLKHGMEGP